jgi:hypothetical protein
MTAKSMSQLVERLPIELYGHLLYIDGKPCPIDSPDSQYPDVFTFVNYLAVTANGEIFWKEGPVFDPNGECYMGYRIENGYATLIAVGKVETESKPLIQLPLLNIAENYFLMWPLLYVSIITPVPALVTVLLSALEANFLGQGPKIVRLIKGAAIALISIAIISLGLQWVPNMTVVIHLVWWLVVIVGYILANSSIRRTA